ncbi:ABC transporter permease [Pseudonocardia sp. CA-107938]|uniref:ABC transporter permease n=1 Tax=Pseudonocardia sp. CA-107938 TaxID=3240021 RepID=UPI003D8B9F87
MSDMTQAAPPILEPERPRSAARSGRLAKAARALSFQRVSALYILAVIVVVFGIWVPDTFLSLGTWKSVLDTQSLTAIVAIGLAISLSAGAFDLAIGMQAGLAGIVVAKALTAYDMPIPLAILTTLAVSVVVGLISGLVIVRMRIDSFIATLAMSSVLVAVVQWVSDSQQILDLPEDFQSMGTTQFLGLTPPVWIMLAVALVAWYVLERAPIGRYIYATGGNAEAARLAGVPVRAVVVLSLIAGGAIASIAGILSSSRIGVGDPTVGPAYLLPAFAAATLGSTQFRGGRYNIAGTVLSVYVLAAGSKGLQLAGAPVWIPDLFNGLAIILAVGLARYEGTSARAAAIRQTLRRQAKAASWKLPRE